MSLGAARLLRLPIQDKGLQIVALAGLMLSAIGAEGGAHHIDLMLGLGRDQEVSMGFQEHLPENVRLEGMTDWLLCLLL